MTDYEPYGVRHFLREADPEGASELRRRERAAAQWRSGSRGCGYADIDEFRLARSCLSDAGAAALGGR